MSFELANFISQIFSNPMFFLVTILLSAVIFFNGFSDAPNAIATCVSTRAISPKKSLVMAAIFNFLGIFVMSMINASVVYTIFNLVKFSGNNSQSLVTLIAALVSIIIWTIITSRRAIPTSESHALIAALTGSSVALTSGFLSVNGGEWVKVLFGMVISIVVGFIVGYVVCKIVESIFKNIDRRKTLKGFKYAQILGGASMSFMHGAQAGQKFIGVFILGIMLVSGQTNTSGFSIPIWLMIYCSLLMTIGTSIGGYKIIKTVGTKMSNLELYQGAIVDISTAGCLLFASIFGIPMSTSHTKSLVITGVGACKRLSNINWRIVKNILLAGIITFPCCGLVAFIITKILLVFC